MCSGRMFLHVAFACMACFALGRFRRPFRPHCGMQGEFLRRGARVPGSMLLQTIHAISSLARLPTHPGKPQWETEQGNDTETVFYSAKWGKYMPNVLCILGIF